jgi:hypothetical protein
MSLKSFMAIVPWLLLSTGAVAAVHSVTKVQVVPLHWGLNNVKSFMPDGRDVTVLRVWRDNGNAHGYTKFVAMFQGKQKEWSIVGIMSDARLGMADSIEDVPHTGEDNVASVRFARAQVDGTKASLLIVAQRNLSGGRSYYDPSPTTISFYQLLDAQQDGPGTTPFAFRPIQTVHPKTLYCNSDLALTKEVGVPLPETYGGPNTLDGCFPEKR